MVKLTQKSFVIIGIIIFIAIISWVITSYFVTPGDYDDFAKCLTEKDVMMYGAEWCQSCKRQKIMFGKSFKYVDYVECPENPGLCKEKGIEGYPTWIVDGESYSGVQQLETLSLLTGCPLD